MGKINIQGVSVEGENIVVLGDKVFVDGAEIAIVANGKLDIRVEGTIQSLAADGNVTAQQVKGNVQAGGTVTCDCVGGAVSTKGNVKCGRIGGSVSAGGSVRHA